MNDKPGERETILEWANRQKEQQQKQQAYRAPAPTPAPDPRDEWQNNHTYLLESFNQSVQADREQRAHFLQELERQIAPAIQEEREQARAALQEAQAHVQQAGHALAQHERITPSAGEVPAWAKRRAELQAELDAFSAIEERASTRVHQAEQRYRGELYHLWQTRLSEARAQLEQTIRDGAQRVQAAHQAWLQAMADAQKEEKRAASLFNSIQAAQP